MRLALLSCQLSNGNYSSVDYSKSLISRRTDIRKNKLDMTLVFLIGILSVNLHAQDLPVTSREKRIAYSSGTIQIDTLSIVPGSISVWDVNGQPVSKENFEIDYVSSKLLFKTDAKDDSTKVYRVKYRTLAIDLGKPYFHKDTLLVLKNLRNQKQIEPYKPVDETFFDDDDKLSKNGSISRGIEIGNRRDLGTLSNFNLQLSGKLNDEVSILASVSDNNIPIQPMGNTQQLQEFDKVSIHMFTQNSGIALGDLEMEKPEGYFLSLQKQTRGLRFYTGFSKDTIPGHKFHTSLVAGIAKGKYKRQNIAGIEGNQGPYKLIGSNSESYIIVLSGSEKIYLNGKLLTRGDKFDYVIDYNSAELVFTTNQPIMSDSRIVAEFEYSQQFFPRMQFLQSNILKHKKSTFWLNLYHENDNKNDPLSENYTNETKQLLAGLGDNANRVFVPNVRRIGFSADNLRYLMKDSLVNGTTFDSVFVFSTNPDLAHYQLGFTYVGPNQGNYSAVVSQVNGKIFEWVAPVNNQKQGSYDPVIQYISPQKASLANLGGIVQIGSKGNLGFELAISGFDANTYSKLDKEDNIGYALKFNTLFNIINDTGRQEFKVFTNFRMADKHFKPIDNYQEIEFERNWNLTPNTPSWEEKYVDGGFHYYFKKNVQLKGTGAYTSRANNYNARVANFSARIAAYGFKTELFLNYLTSNDLRFKTAYLKHRFMLSKQTKHFTFGISEETEDNKWSSFQSTDLAPNSFRFSEYSLFLQESDSSVNKFFIRYTYRQEYLPDGPGFSKKNNAQTAQAGLQILKLNYFTAKTILTYRQIQLNDTARQTANSDNYLSGRQEVNLRLGKGSLAASAFYETGLGLEAVKQYQYFEVQKGQGFFAWIDYNQNNIKEIGEFEPAKFPDEADHIQIFIPSNTYLNVYTTQMSGSFLLLPAQIWIKEKGLKGFVARFSNHLTGQVMQKADHPDFFPDLQDNSSLISRIFLIRNTFTFRTRNRKLEIEHIADVNSNKNILISGFDIKKAQNQEVRTRYQFNQSIANHNSFQVGRQDYQSEYLRWKDFQIEKKSMESNLEFRLFNTLLSNLGYQFTAKSNKNGGENAAINKIRYQLNQEVSAKINLQAEFSFIAVKYSGELRSNISYEMLEGLSDGNNLVWNITYHQKLSKVLYLTLSYHGRSAGNIPAIHNGTAQIRANF
jgi:hypothetical protein